MLQLNVITLQSNKNCVNEINLTDTGNISRSFAIDIRDHNRVAIESHPMTSTVEMIKGSSTSPKIIE